jgi:UDP-N-acetylmuramate--alanine ligase
MRALPLTIGTIHFVGIGGIGMSGIAEILHNLGYVVQGSDQGEGANVRRLRDLGVSVAIGHAAENLGEAQVVVISSAVKADNIEVETARRQHLPVVRRAEMLGELMRLKWSIAVGGTHGKTTTTSLVAAILDTAELDPTVINGGIVDAFVANIPFYGFAALCIDHAEVQAMIPRVSDRKIVTYGFSPQADVRGENLTMDAAGCRFDVAVAGRNNGDRHVLTGLTLPMLGRHNVQNALAAVAVAREMDLDDDVVRKALASFEGVKRRFTRTGEVDGIIIIDDYGHHPVEIAAVLAAARTGAEGKVIAVVQPHRFTRLRDLFEDFCTCFNDADAVLVADVYAAGEEPIDGVDRQALAAGLLSHGHRTVVSISTPEDLPALVNDLAAPGDMVVCLGAGDITAWAQALPEQLAALRPPAREAGE